MSAIPAALARAVEARRDDLIALTRDLVRIPTTNPPGDAYRDCAEFLGRGLPPEPDQGR